MIENIKKKLNFNGMLCFKIFKFILFYLFKINIFLIFLDYFDIIMLKIIFKN
jgi:hypothetical protein